MDAELKGSLLTVRRKRGAEAGWRDVGGVERAARDDGAETCPYAELGTRWLERQRAEAAGVASPRRQDSDAD
jgi:hypothetical protein